MKHPQKPISYPFLAKQSNGGSEGIVVGGVGVGVVFVGGLVGNLVLVDCFDTSLYIAMVAMVIFTFIY